MNTIEGIPTKEALVLKVYIVNNLKVNILISNNTIKP